VSAYQNSYFK